MSNKIFKKEIFAKRLSELIKENNETIYTMAEKFHLSPSAFSRYTSAEMVPKIIVIEAIALKFGINPVWLMGGNAPKYLPDDNKQVDYIKVPVVGIIRAGEPILAQQNIIENICIPEDMARGKDIFALKVIGDSMNNARINEGDTVIVEKQNEVENGEIAVVLVNGEDATIKRFYHTNTIVTLVPESSNPIHRPRVIDLSKSEVKVLGKVIGALIKF